MGFQSLLLTHIDFGELASLIEGLMKLKSFANKEHLTVLYVKID